MRRDERPVIIKEETETISFPVGFQVYSKAKVRRNSMPKRMMVTLSKNRTLYFNVLASKYIFGDRNQNQAVFVAYNPVDRVLAVKPVPYKLKEPKTYTILRAGADGNTAGVSFDAQSKYWNIPMLGKRVPCMWDENRGMMLIPLSGV